MTVKVTITHTEAGSNRPITVQVAEVDVGPNGKQFLSAIRDVEIAPGGTEDFYVHRNQSLMIEENIDPLPLAAPEAPKRRR